MAKPNEENAHSGHRDRVRQRIREEGLEGLGEHELIEFLLFYVFPRQDVNELAHRLVGRFGSARAVLSADPASLMRVSGMGRHSAQWLALVGEAAFACAHLSPADRTPLRNCMDSFRYALRVSRELGAPCCVQLCLDATGRLLYRSVLCPSLSWGEADTLRSALRDVLSSQAYSALLLLLSDRASPEPEDYDIRHAGDYALTLRAAGCELLDVILVGGDRLCSMRRSGRIPGLDEDDAARALHEDYLRAVPSPTLRIAEVEEGS